MRDDRSAGERQELERRLRRKSYREKLRRKRQIRRNLTVFAIVTVILIAAVGTVVNGHIQSVKKAKATAAQAAAVQKQKMRLAEEQAAAQKQEQLEKDNTLTLVAVGDNILHDHIIETQEEQPGNWNFEFLYEHVKPEIEQADLAVVNQETVLTENHGDVSGYPCFETPAEVADALVNTGFDIVEQASNHAYDCGTSGVLQTLDYWNGHFPHIKVLGIHRSTEEAANIPVVEKKGFKLAFLNYTYGVNQEPIPADQGYLIDIFSEQRVIQDIEAARKTADCVIVGLHAGEEGSGEISDYTRHMVQTIADAGGDIILGSHPHVLQKYEVVTGNSGHQTLVYYSLGNFISTQQDPSYLLGGMAQITIKRYPDTGQCRIESAGMQPLFMYYHYDTKEYAAYWLKDCTPEMFANSDIHSETEVECTHTSIQTMADTVLSQSSFSGPIVLQ
ncbi:MAG: CapA family protein [Lachnospiraceae bacterium]|nr:CapA family protein [Lachnospiraceae bacterium]